MEGQADQSDPAASRRTWVFVNPHTQLSALTTTRHELIEKLSVRAQTLLALLVASVKRSRLSYSVVHFILVASKAWTVKLRSSLLPIRTRLPNCIQSLLRAMVSKVQSLL